MSNKASLIVDAFALLLLAAASFPALTGNAVHEWASTAAILVLLVHTGIHGSWFASVLKKSSVRRPIAGLAMVLLAVLMFLSLAACAVSGIMESGAVLLAFGLHAKGYYFWGPFHAMAAKALLALLLVHIVLHASWIAKAARRGSSRSPNSN